MYRLETTFSEELT